VPLSRRSGFPHGTLKSLAIILVGSAGLILAPVISGYAVSVGGHSWPMRSVALLLTLAILYLMFLLLVRIALPTKVPIRKLRPAAIISTIGLVLLQVSGSLVLTHQLKHLNTLYGTFAVVLGLLFWLYLQAQLFYYAIETASVRALSLWPRAIDQQNLTPQDQKALRLHIQRSNPSRETEVTVAFKDKQS
jgi:uncharacterized BrkB/YihY/UPF0761 family membrane protein